MTTDAVNNPPHYNAGDKKKCTHCRSCARDIKKSYYANNPEKALKRKAQQKTLGKKWYQANRDRLRLQMRRNWLKRNYGITTQEYDTRLANQGGVCAICGADKSGRSHESFIVDHDHNTGDIRGLLCHKCNVGLGAFGDDRNILKKALEYVCRPNQ